MECNKDEAVRAKEIAEKKLLGNDFEGARRIALKAKSLFPELENISQLLAVCNVHCSAESRMLGSEKDWYGILEVERSVDEATIKKQYRKLALVLHPDKNKFPGAEAAFKLIGEAHRVLSDCSSRSQYDAKVSVALKFAQTRPPSHKVNVNPPAKKQFPGQNSAPNGVFSQFRSANHQATHVKATHTKESFWTCCPICKIRYQFYRDFENKVLRCQKCLNPYVAHNLGAHGVSGSSQSHTGPAGVPPPFNQSQPAKQKDDPIQGPGGSSLPKTGVPVASHVGSHENAGSASAGPGTGLRSTVNANKMKDDETEGTALPKGVKLPSETGFTKKSRKRGKKSEPEFDEIYDVSDSSTEESDIEKYCSGHAAGVSSKGNTSHFVRRSDRQKHQVSYIDSGSDDDDFESPPKRSRKENSPCKGEPECEEVLNHAHPVNQQENAPQPGPSVEEQTNASQAAAQKPNAATAVFGQFGEVDVSKSDDNKSFDVPESEFCNFDQLREESCFEIGQIWACYEEEGLPRYYALIRKVYSVKPFKVSITWLEPDPDDEDENGWVERDLPVGCGKFRLGCSQDEKNIGVFSHQMDCKMVSKKSRRVTFKVYPRKGETWALFKDWDISWSADVYKKCKYEIVEVVSDFMEGVGVEVAFLEKLNGFVSLFQRRNQKRAGSILVPATEMFRFSYRIPSSKMTGCEKEGVVEGSLELDPAGLANGDDASLPSVSDSGIGNRSAEANCITGEPPKMSKLKCSVDENTPKKPMNSMRNIGVAGESIRLRKSPRGLKIMGENRQMNTSAGLRSSGHVNCEESKSDYSHFTDGVSTAQVDKRTGKERKGSSTSSPGRNISENLLHDFGEDRSERKFEVNQIWALYTPEQKLPKIYGQIKRVDFSPFNLHVAPLEPISPPENVRQRVCGTFKVKGGKPRVFEPSLFSHQVEAKVDKKQVLIYPKVGEVWALYSDWSAELTPSALENCASRPVEIINVNKDCIQVLPLEALTPSYKLIFRSFGKQPPNSKIVDVPVNELGRFSHQIPAIRLTAEKGRRFAGNLLLDAAALPDSK